MNLKHYISYFRIIYCYYLIRYNKVWKGCLFWKRIEVQFHAVETHWTRRYFMGVDNEPVLERFGSVYPEHPVTWCLSRCYCLNFSSFTNTPVLHNQGPTKAQPKSYQKPTENLPWTNQRATMQGATKDLPLDSEVIQVKRSAAISKHGGNIDSYTVTHLSWQQIARCRWWQTC